MEKNRKKDFDPLDPKVLIRLKEVFGLQDWDITIKIDKVKKAKSFGEAFVQACYRRATIILYEKTISEEKIFNETYKKVLYHEFGEILSEMHAQYLPSDIREKKYIEEMKDSIADHISRTVLRLEEHYENK